MATIPDPNTLIEVGESAAKLAKELIETNREIEVTVENETSALVLEPGRRFGGSQTQCLSSVVQIKPGEREGMVYSKPRGTAVGCWGYQSFVLKSKGTKGKLLVVFFSVPAVGSNAFLITEESNSLHFDHHQAKEFYDQSSWSSVGTMTKTIAGYTVRANMSDSYTAQMTVWIEDSQ